MYRSMVTAVVVGVVAVLTVWLVPTSLPADLDDKIILHIPIAVHRLCNSLGKILGALGVKDGGMKICRFHLETAGWLLKRNLSGIQTVDGTFQGRKFRVFKPSAEANNIPTVVYFHGGGFIYGGLESYYNFGMQLAKKTGYNCIFLDYPLSPEARYPSQINIAEAFVHFLLDEPQQQQQLRELNIDRSTIMIAGESAGGMISAAVTRRLTSKNIPVSKLALLAPMLQFYDNMLPSHQDYISTWAYGDPDCLPKIITRYFGIKDSTAALRNDHLPRTEQLDRMMDWSAIPAELVSENHRRLHDNVRSTSTEHQHQFRQVIETDASPLLASDRDLARYPKTFLASLGVDALRDENYMMVHRLRQNGVDVVHQHYPRSYHHILIVCTVANVNLPICDRMMTDLANFLTE